MVLLDYDDMTLGDFDNTGENEQVAFKQGHHVCIEVGKLPYSIGLNYLRNLQEMSVTAVDDLMGLTDEECEEIQRFLEAAEGYPVDVDLETQGFYRCNDAGTLPGECADFIFHKCND